MKHAVFQVVSALFAILLAIASLGPFCYVLLRSFASWEGVSFQPYYQVFWGQSQYLVRFWKSLGMSCCVGAGQLVISALAGFGFARYRFKGRNTVFFLLTILMVLPVQVTLVPNYIMLNQLGLLDTYAALILPLIFVPLGTFILRQSFLSIPDSVMDAAMLDGCGALKILCRVAIPMNLSGMVCAFLLSFLDAWNMVEQPIAYLREANRYPISVALVYVTPSDTAIQLACCVLVALPCLFLFTFFNRELVEGITLAEVK